MDQAIRNKLRNVVTQCRRLLEDSVSQELQGKFGIYAARKDDVQPLTLVPGGASVAGDDLAAFRTPAAQAPVPAPAIPTRGRPQKSVRAERTKHDEKITVYLSAEELLGLEGARLVLRGQHGVAADRGRIVREAIAVILADLEDRGDESVLVRRLRGA